MIAKLFHQFRKLLKVLAQSDYRRAFWKTRVAAGMEHERLLRSLGCATVVDIGANRGQFALVSRHCLPAARIISFEPLAAPAACFRAVLGDDPLTTLHQVAIGPAESEAVIHVAAEDDSSSLLPMTALQKSMYSGMKEVGTETIRVETLAQRVTAEDLRPPALLKIDVQGYELSTLRGLRVVAKQIRVRLRRMFICRAVRGAGAGASSDRSICTGMGLSCRAFTICVRRRSDRLFRRTCCLHRDAEAFVDEERLERFRRKFGLFKAHKYRWIHWPAVAWRRRSARLADGSFAPF